MKVVYIAGAFRAETAWQIAENVREAERWALKVAECGAMPLCPHTNTQHFHGMLDEKFWVDGTLELLKRCDGALFLPGWVKSRGSMAEHRWCVKNGLPFFGVGHVTSGGFTHWLKTGEES